MGWFPGGGGDLTSLTHCLGAQGLQPNSSGKRVCDIAGDERVKGSPVSFFLLPSWLQGS